MKKLFIHIPKTGGTSVKNSLNIISNGHNSWNCYNLKKYYTFSIVRNPWDRVVSNYKFCKMNENMYYYKNSPFGRYNIDYEILKNKNFEKTLRLLEWNFLKHIGWKSQNYFICDENKNIKIDKIYKFENLNELENDFNIKLDHLNKSYKGNYKNYFNKKLIDKVFKIYKDDIKLFNYEF